MADITRPRVVVIVALAIVGAAYLVFARQEAPANAIERVEQLVAPYSLSQRLETQRTLPFSASADIREIHVQRSFATLQLRDRGGTSIHGITACSVSVFGWTEPLQEAMLDTLNESPTSARKLVEHDDERIQFLALKILTDWGRNQWARPLDPHAIDTLLTFAERKDPHFAGTAIHAVRSKGVYSEIVFRAGMAHQSSDIRAETLRWFHPERHRLAVDQLRAAAPILIEHLADRDLVVRQWSMLSLQSLAAYWEHSLGGAPFEQVRLNQSLMTALPVAPSSSRWYHEVFPPQLKLAQTYRDEWQEWLRMAEAVQ